MTINLCRTLVCAAATLVISTARAQTTARWEPVGLSGGGAMFTPAISPVDPNRMLVNCDMSAAYVTVDAGRHWQMISYDQLHGNTQCRPAFHPTDPRTVYAADGNLKVSHDGGIHWQPIGNLPGDLRGEIAVDPGHPARMLVGAGTAVFHSDDAGKTWMRCEGPHGDPLAFHFDRTSPESARVCFAATRDGLWRSGNGGRTWTDKTAGLPVGGVIAFAGASRAAPRECLLYLATPGRVVNGMYQGGIFRSRDRGETWQSVMNTGLNREIKAFDEWAMGPVAQYVHLAASDAVPRTIYAINTSTGVPPPHHATVYRSDNAGETWRATFQADPRYPARNVEQDYTVYADHQFYSDVPGVAIAAHDPNRVILVDGGRCYVTTDGGKTWRSAHTEIAPGSAAEKSGPRWLCNGLVVTTTWNYYIDPLAPQRHYICYTDIGFALSEDSGKTWRWWPVEGRAPWANTCYELAFDPETPGKVWGAFSESHDIPNYNIISGNHRGDRPGGICVSTDHAVTWKASNNGLPLAPVTGVALDPRSAKGARTLYAGVFGHGVYKSTDDGRTWTARSTGLGTDTNRRVCRITLHPDGTLFALVTARRQGQTFLADGAGVYRSADGGETWKQVNASQPLLWPKDLTVDPRDSRILYVGACDTNGQETGGLYRTGDGGATWQRLTRQGAEHFGAYLSPTHPGWLYTTLTEGAPGAGLWLSQDNGATWQPMKGLPFSNAQRVAFDPRDPGHIYVTTFGGSVWRGPAAE